MNNAYKEWEKRTEEELAFWSSKEGTELQLCLIEQDYEERISCRLMILFGSGFTALKIIDSLKEDYLK